MANIDQAFGLRPIAKVGSAPGGTTGTTKYSIASGASGIFTGDPVKQANDGTVVVATDATNLVAANLNENCNLVFGSGSTTTGISGVEIDSSSKNTTAALQVKLIDFYDTPSNDATANNSIFVVKINNHELNGGTGTTGSS
jgi:hypothetical protein